MQFFFFSDGKGVSENRNDTESEAEYALVEDLFYIQRTVWKKTTFVSEISDIMNEEKC